MDIINCILIVVLILQVSYLTYKIAPKINRGERGKASFVDTSALMDGRIVTAAQTGFIPNSLIVPKSVIAELQYLADQADAEKRLRARRGLDAISELQDVPGLNVEILDDGPTDKGGVDERLIVLAKKHGGSIITIDFNLNKVATVQGIKILNINELAGSIRMAFLPGETLKLELTQKGQESSQAVGYLPDGTMVVVDKASQYISKTVEIEVIRSLQTAAGRMLFAKLSRQTEPTREKSKAQPAHPSLKSARPLKSTPVGRAPVAPVKRAAAKTDSKPTPRRKSKRNGEDSLIELVNNQ